MDANERRGSSPLILLLGLGLVGCAVGGTLPGGGSDDDDVTGQGDDDTAAGDDDSGDDDSVPGDDDTVPGGDDDTVGDDDSGDDDSSPGDDDSSPGDDDSGDDDTAPLPDLSVPGPYAVTTTTSWVTPSGFVPTQATLFAPTGAPAAPTVVLAHGFSRYQGAVAGLAEHYASWGLPVVTATLLHIYPIDNAPEQDAQDMIWLSDEIGGGGPVLYAGHSAGGMRAVLAGVADPDTVAVLGLDLVDASMPAWGNVFLAAEQAPDLAVPLGGVAGEPTDCNSTGNGLAVYAAAPQGEVLRAVGADHCDFEAPTDLVCTGLCPNVEGPFDDDAVRATIRSLSTAFLLQHAGLLPEGAQWWTPGGEPYDALLASGAVEVP